MGKSNRARTGRNTPSACRAERAGWGRFGSHGANFNGQRLRAADGTVAACGEATSGDQNGCAAARFSCLRRHHLRIVRQRYEVTGCAIERVDDAVFDVVDPAVQVEAVLRQSDGD